MPQRESPDFSGHVESYSRKLHAMLDSPTMLQVDRLARSIARVWREDRYMYFCGNGGSAGNANHLANDFTYGVGVRHGKGIRVESLAANPSVLTCLGNDIGFENVFSEQVRVKGRTGDLLVVFSGSGNSENVVRAVDVANEIGMETVGILGYDGGRCSRSVSIPIHFAVDDMQVAEDLQLTVGHLIMQWLCETGPGYGLA